VTNQTVVPIPTCSPSHIYGHSHTRGHGNSRTHDRDHEHDHGNEREHSHGSHHRVKAPTSTGPQEITLKSIDLAERGAGVERRKMIMSIEGMDCPSCAIRVTNALNTVPSVTQPKVNTFSGEATLMYDVGTVSPDEIARRVTGLTGFNCKFEQDLREEDLMGVLWVSVPSKWDDYQLPAGVSIKNRKLTKNKENLLEVQYDSSIIQPRDVVAAFELWDGEYLPLDQVRGPSQASKDLWLLLRRTVLSAIATTPILIFAWAPLPKHPVLYGSISLVLATFVQFYIALPIYRSGFRALFRQHVLDMDLLVAGSTSIAYTYSIISFGFLAAGKPIDESFFETSALLVTLIMVGELVSAFARRRTTSALETVDTLQARTVNLVEYGNSRSIPAELVHVGDILQVSPDSTIPTDGVIRSGVTQVDESSLTGESKPVEKQRGSPVIAGTLNLSGSIEITASRTLSENTISGISRLMHDAQESRLPIQDLADKVASYFAPTILGLGLLAFVIWIFIGKFVQGRTAEKAGVEALMKMITVFVVSCPCAIALCVPMVVVIAVSVAAKKGVLFKVGCVELLGFFDFTHLLPFTRSKPVHRGDPIRKGHYGSPLRQDWDAHGRKPLRCRILFLHRRRRSAGIPSHQHQHPPRRQSRYRTHQLPRSFPCDCPEIRNDHFHRWSRSRDQTRSEDVAGRKLPMVEPR
jgi:cation transport ATPase